MLREYSTLASLPTVPQEDHPVDVELVPDERGDHAVVIEADRHDVGLHG